MQQRAMKRMVIEQARDQANIEEVVRLALPHLKDDATPEKMDNDWIASFFDQCRIVSNEEMQTLWGRILASEANEAGSFSKRTLRLVSDLDKQDAEMFTALCRFIWGFKPSVLQPLILKVGASIYGDNGVTFGSLTHLDDIGLITFDGLGGFTRKRFSGEVDASYWGQKFRFHFAEASGNEINIGNVLMTQPGIQLARICGAQGIQGVPDYVFEYYQSHAPKMGIACVLPQPDTA
ncbi:MAG TPA: DUF2806 domain-containing protein [Methyloceanibacter sp.]|nr:DUF2806 domain-containing protein [Methyloceanibacter sp.]